mmetsp:Transcript_48073/g.56166  ORF Transcript_48073/g.56166 Transcript_48073/m.56166 type:complete len:111 (+) Transcript_48073:520-852(+)
MVLDSLGKLNKELNVDSRGKYENKYEIIVEKKADITFDKEELLTKDFSPSVHINEAAYHTLCKLIETWRYHKLLSDTPDNLSEPSVPSTDKQKITLKLFSIKNDLKSLMQ